MNVYNILIVDDEKYILIGLEQGIEWNKIGIDHVFTATNVAKAKELLQNNRIDIILCDIEMPQENGLEFIEYAKNCTESVKCIFLTAYSNFDYAQKAMRLGCVDYILKPYDDSAVIGAIEKAITEIEEENEITGNLAVYQKYKDIYTQEIKNIVNSLWREFVTGNFTSEIDAFINRLYVSDIQVGYDTKFLVVMLSVDFWYGDVDAKTKQILLFGIENITEELLNSFVSVNIFTDNDMNQVAILYAENEIDKNAVKDVCRKVIKCVNEIIECDISCYLDMPCDITGLQQSYLNLSACIKNNLTTTNTIIENSQKEQKVNISTYDFTSWSNLIRQKKQDELKVKIDLLFQELSDNNLGYGYLNMYISGFSYIMYQLINDKMINTEGINKIEELLIGASEINNLLQLKKWTEAVLDMYFYYYNDIKTISMAVEQTKKYIEANFTNKLVRDDMAKNVCLNADYLSRIFHKEMGISISDYITKLRMDMAKDMLIKTKCTITQISELCGYYNFSYFTKMFKKIYGISPIEFRKSIQNM